MFKASLIISFYKKIDVLKLVLAGLELQSFKNFEVIISDDGSPKEITDEIKKIQAISPLHINHVWHEDNGFRKTILLNESIRQSKSDYLIFIDGDCIPHHLFVQEHLNEQQQGYVLAGRRVNLSAKMSALMTEHSIKNGYLQSFSFKTKLFIDGIFGKSTHVEKGRHYTNKFLRKFFNRKDAGVLGCNFSLYKKDLVEVNGFDERYLAPAVGEDTDVEARLRWNGIKVKTIKNLAIQYHLYHKLLDRPSINLEIYKKVVAEKIAFTPYGLVKKNV